MTQWIYVFGERTGVDIKIGRTDRDTIRHRLDEVDGEANDDTYVLLAAVRGEPSNEKAMRLPFRYKSKGKRREYIYPDEDAVEYVNWLRAQWFTCLDIDEPAEGFVVRHADEWLPTPERRIARPVVDETKMIQDYDGVPSPLSGTVWSWMTNPKASFQDYFTPAAIVDAAREAMGDIDLDAASHWAANKIHRIPNYFDTTRSAFENPWFGRVWLNPPYGENEPWFREIEHWVTTGGVEQLCMLSPVWAFTTKIARPVMDLTSAMILLSPTPTFWGNALGRTGANHPHAIIYIGNHATRFREAFRPFGMPLQPHWESEFIPEEAAS